MVTNTKEDFLDFNDLAIQFEATGREVILKAIQPQPIEATG